MEQEVLKILSSGKSLDRYKKVLHLLNGEDSGDYEEEIHPQRKRFLGWGCIRKKLICAYYSIKGGKRKWSPACEDYEEVDDD